MSANLAESLLLPPVATADKMCWELSSFACADSPFVACSTHIAAVCTQAASLCAAPVSNGLGDVLATACSNLLAPGDIDVLEGLDAGAKQGQVRIAVL